MFWLLFCSECGLTRAFKDRGIDGPSHSQLPKNLLYLVCRFLGSHGTREIFVIGPSHPTGYNNPIYKVVSALKLTPLPPPVQEAFMMREYTPTELIDVAGWTFALLCIRVQTAQRVLSISLSITTFCSWFSSLSQGFHLLASQSGFVTMLESSFAPP